jgi:hypothetical protein
MIRIVVLLLAAVLAWPSDAVAQNSICATAPPGDNSNRCASDAFVQQSAISTLLKWPAVTDAQFGAVCNGSTDDATAVAAAMAAFVPIYIGPGLTCKVSTASAALAGRIFGEGGQLKDGSGNQRGYFFSAITANKAYTASNENSLETAFNGDFSGVSFAVEHRITGAATLTQPVSNYVYSPWAYPHYTNMFNSSGWNQSTSTDVGGRTAALAYRTVLNHTGLGDGFAYNGEITVSGLKPGATSWLANGAGGIANGDVFAGASGVHLNPMEIHNIDNGFDVAAHGYISSAFRSNNTGALGVYWSNFISQSFGTKPIEAVLIAQGLHLVGIDLTAITFSGTNPIAFAAPPNSRVCLNESSSNGAFMTSSCAQYIDYNSTAGTIQAVGAPFQPAKGTAAALPGCAAGSEGAMQAVTDANANTWGTTIVGGSTNHVLAYCDGTNWTIMAK